MKKTEVKNSMPLSLEQAHNYKIQASIRIISRNTVLKNQSNEIFDLSFFTACYGPTRDSP